MGKNNTKNRRPVIEEVEPRILYSADFIPITLDDPLDAAGLPAEIRILETPEQQDTPINHPVINSNDILIIHDNAVIDTVVTTTHELVIIDTATPDYQLLVDDILANPSEAKQFEVVLLDQSRDGIAQISEILSNYSNLDAVHLISHGSTGEVTLGNSQLNFDTLLNNASNIQGWGNALDTDADILIYGCDLASTRDGENLIDALGKLTNADIAASNDLTGHAQSGGDWDLEYAAGTIEAEIAVSANLQNNWSSVLGLTADGANFQVNTTTTDSQKNGDVALFDDGSYVTVWDSLNDGSGEGTYFRIFNADGTEKVSETLVNQTTTNQQIDPAVAVSANGDFVVSWTSTQNATTDIYVRIYDSNGVAQSNETLVNTAYTSGEQRDSDVAIDDTGNFVVVWEGEEAADAIGIYGQRFDAAGSAVGTVFLINDTITASLQQDAAIAMNATGEFVVTWTDSSTSNTRIAAQQFTSAGVGQGEFVVHATNPSQAEALSSVAIDDAGNFVVVWGESNADGAAYGVMMQRFDANGVRLEADDVLVNTTTTADQFDPSIAMRNTGEFVVSWTSGDQDSDANGVVLQQFNADGTKSGSETVANTYTTSDQHVSQVSINDAGKVVVIWEGSSSGDSIGITGQRYDVPVVDKSSIWITTDNDVTGSGVTGLDAWSQGQVLQFADPNLSFEPNGTPIDTTSGTLTSVLNLDNLVQDLDTSVNAIHYVSSDIRVGNPAGGADSFDLLAGDLILSTEQAETLTGTNGNLSVTEDDAFVFRPTTANDYSDGAFYFLLDGSQLSGVSTLHGLSLIEQDVTVGDSLLTAGSFLLSEEGLFDIQHFTATGVGTGTNTQGTLAKLIDGSDIGFDSFVRGIDIVEETVVIGGTTIAQGNILVTFSADDSSVGDNSINTDQQDIFYITVTKTEFDQATTVANATLLLDGSDVALDATDEDIWGFTLLSTANSAPTAANSTVTANEDTSHTFTATDFNFSDVDGDTLTSVKITTLQTVGALQLSGVDVILNQVITKADIDAGNLKFVPVADANGASYDSFGFSVNDGTVDSVASYTMIVDMTAVNDAPTLTATPASTVFNENAAPVDLFSAITVSTVEAAQTIEALVFTVTNVTDGVTAGADEFISIDATSVALTNGNSGTTSGNTYSYAVSLSGNTATVTLTLSTTPAAIVTLVDGLSYQNTSENPTVGNREITLTNIKDNGGTANGGVDTSNPSITATITVVSANDAAVLAAIEGAALAYTENDAATVITSAITVSDVDDTDVESAVIKVTGNYQNGEDILAFANIANITGLWDAATGTLTLTGTDTAAAYETALQSVTYQNSSDNPSALTRTVSFTVNDGTIVSNTQTRDISVTAVNDAPTLTATASDPSFSEGGAAQGIFSGSAVGTVEAGQTIEQLIFTVTNIADGANEVVNIDGSTIALTNANSGTTAGNSYGFSVSLVGSTATVTLTTTGTSTANIQTLVDGLSYQNNSDNPTVANRVVTLASIRDSGGTANGGVDTSALAVASTVTVTAANDASVLASIEAGTLAYTENDVATAITSAITVSDVDDTNIESAVIQITGNYQNGEDILAFSNTANITGSWDALTGTLTLTGTDTLAAYETALQSVTYQNGSDDPSTLTRTVSFTVNDGTIDSNTQTRDIGVTAVNDDPLITSNGGGATASVNVVENTTAVTTVSSSDTDGGVPSYSISGGADAGKFSIISASGALTFSAAPDFENPTDVGLDNVYEVEVTVSDGNGGSDLHSISVTVTNANDAPTAANNTVTTNEYTSYTFVAADFNFADIDGDSMVSVKITTLETVGALQLSGVDITLNQVISKVDIDAGNLKFVPVANANGASYDSFGFSVNDGTVDSVANYTMTVDVTAVNDVPLISNVSTFTTEDTDITYTQTAFTSVFTDDDGDSMTLIKVTSLPTNGILKLSGVDVAINQLIATPDIDNLTFTPTANWSGSTSFSWLGHDGTIFSAASTATITINAVNDAPVFNNLDATPTFIEDGAAVVLDTNVTVNDPELDAIDNYSGTTLLLLRNAGANAEDSFAFTDGNGLSLVGSNLIYNSQIIASFDTTSSPGVLQLQFTDTNGETPTNALVSSTLQKITYANSSNTPPASVQLLWIFLDGNSGAQGIGGSESILANTTVNITASNDLPTANAGGVYSILEGDSLTLDSSASTDPEGDALTYHWDLDNDGAYDDLTTAASSSTLNWATLQSAGITDDGLYTIGLQVDDGNGGIATTTTNLTVVNTAPVLITTGANTVDEDAVYTLNLSAADPGDDTLTSWTINWGDGSIETIAGNATSATHVYTQPGLIYDILVAATDEDGTFHQNELLVASYNNSRVLRYDPTTGTETQTLTTGTGLNGQVEMILGPDDNLYVSGYGNGGVQRFDPQTGAFIDIFVPMGTGGLSGATGIAFGADGNLYVSSYSLGKVFRFDGGTGAFIDIFIAPGSGGLASPEGIAFAQDGNLYVSDYDNNQILRYDGTTGAFIDVFITPSSGGLQYPEQITFGPDGNFYASSWSNQVLRYDGTTGAFIDAFATSPNAFDLNGITGISFGPDGHLYVSGFVSDNVARFDGTTGAFMDYYIPNGSSTLNGSYYLLFLPEQRVTVSPVNDAPVLDNLISDQSATEDSPFSYTFAANTFSDEEGDALTYTTSALPAWLSFDDATRTFSGTPANADVGTITVTVTADDGNGGSVNDSFDIVVSNTNDAPAIDNLIPDQAATEDSTFSYTFAANTFSDVDGDSLSYTTSALPSWISFDDATRTFTGTPLNADVGTFSVTITANDGNGGLISDVFNIVVSNTNDAPTIDNLIPDQAATEDSAFNYTFAANTFSDVDGDSLTYTTSALPAWLGFDDATRTFTGTPANVDVGTITITITADDNNGGSVNDSFDIVISNSNDAPTVDNSISDQAAIEDVAFSFTYAANSFGDVDGDSLSYTTSALPGWLSFNDATRTFSGTPLNADVGTVSIAVIADDGNGGSISDTFNIVISNTNDAPILMSNTGLSLNEGATATIDATHLATNDIDNTPTELTYSVTTTPANGQLELISNPGTAITSFTQDDIDNNQLVYVHAGSETTSDSFAFTLIDGSGGTISSTFNISISLLNENPPVTASGQTFSVTETGANGFMLGTVVASDPDTAATLQNWTILSGNTGGVFAINALNGALTIADNNALDYETNPVFTLSISVSDGSNTSIAENVMINILDVSTAIDSGQTFTIVENLIDGSIVGQITTSGDAPTSFSIINGNIGGAFAIDSSGQISITNSTAIDYETQTNFALEIQVNDGSSNSSKTITVSITNINEFAVTAISDNDSGTNQISENATPGSTVGITAFASDSDSNDSVTYSLSNDAGGLFEVNATTGIVTLKDVLDFEVSTSHQINVQAISSDGSSKTRLFNITVLDQNDNPPAIVPNQSFSVDENTSNLTSIGSVAANDTDTVGSLQDWQITGGSGQSVFSIDPNTGVISVADAAQLDFETTSAFTLEIDVSDGINRSSVETTTVFLNDLNEAPVITSNAAIAVNENQSIVGAVSGSDVDLPANVLLHQITGGADASLFSIDAVSGTLTFNVAPDFEQPLDAGSNNQYEVLISLSDGNGGTDSQQVTVSVSDLDELPVAIDDTATTREDSAVTISSVMTNDQVGDGSLEVASFQVVSDQGGVVQDLGNGSFSYQPPADFNGVDTFTYTITDANGDLSQATVVVLVNAENDAPLAAGESFLMEEETSIVLTVADLLSNDVDVDADTLSIEILNEPAHGLLSVDANGDFTYTPNTDFQGMDQMSYRVTDGVTVSQSVDIILQVKPVNDAPVAEDSDVRIDEDSVYAFQASDFNFSDIENDALKGVQIQNLPQQGALLLNGEAVAQDQIISSEALSGGELTYQAFADAYGDGYASLAFSVFDGQRMSVVSASLDIHVDPVNDAPIITATNNIDINPGEPVNLAEFAGRFASIADADAEFDTQKIEISVLVGTLSIADDAGLTIVAGNHSSRILLVGDTKTLNQAMNNLVYTPEPGFSGELMLSIKASDPGVDTAAFSSTANIVLQVRQAVLPGQGDLRDDDTSDSEAPIETVVTTTPETLNRGLSEHFSFPQIKDRVQVSDADLFVPVTLHSGGETFRSGFQLAASEIESEQLNNSDHKLSKKWLDQIQRQLLANFLETEATMPEFKTTPFVLPLNGDGFFSEESNQKGIVINTIEFGTIGLTIGTILWLLRSGGLLSTLLLSYPAWRNVDPLPVFDNSHRQH